MEVDYLTYEPNIENFELMRDIYQLRNGLVKASAGAA